MAREIVTTIATIEFEGVELIGVEGIMQLTHVSRQAVSNWQTRGVFPAPAINLGPARLWRYNDIEVWMANRTKRS